MKKKAIKAVKLKPNELNFDFENPRKITEERMDDLKRSITELGDFGVIVVDENNSVISGNQRVQAMLELDINHEIDCKLLLGYTDEEKKIINIRANKSSGMFDEEILVDWLKDIDSDKLDLTGFQDEDFKLIDFQSDFQKEKEEIEDDVPDIEDEPVVIKLGDLIELGNHRLLCGDSTKEEDVKRLMNGNKADMVFTDPPYGININFGKEYSKKNGSGVTTRNNYKKIKNDTNTEVIKKTYELIKKLGIKNILLWGANYFSDILQPSKCWISWYKKEGLPSDTFCDTELAYTDYDIHSTTISVKWKGMIKEGESGKRVHPNQKPILLVEKIFEYLYVKESILDLFLGSGSTLIAAEKTNRKCYGMELDPHYCQVIIERYLNYTETEEITINGKEVLWKEYKDEKK